MSISYLPEDLHVLVLERLPPETLGRFKSVSKSWNGLISSQEFIKLHLNQYCVNQKPNLTFCRYVIGHPGRYGLRSYTKIHAAEFSETLELSCRIQFLGHVHEKSDALVHVGSCNGLICGIYHPCDIFLFNPLTQSSWDLPKRPALVINDDITCFCGFGYDDVHDDYKVIIAKRPRNAFVYEYEYAVEVYSLRSNSWRRVRSYLDYRDHYISDYNFAGKHGHLVNFALHWLSVKKPSPPNQGRTRNSIVAFDLRTEKHKILSIPDVLEEIHCVFMYGVLNGCLALINNINNNFLGSVTKFELWVMKDYGVKDSWMKITIHDPQRYNLYKSLPVTLIEDNNKRKLIFYDQSMGRILLYDINSHQFLIEYPKTYFCRTYIGSKLHQFVGSLVQPHPPFQEDEEAISRSLERCTIGRKSREEEVIKSKKKEGD